MSQRITQLGARRGLGILVCLWALVTLPLHAETAPSGAAARAPVAKVTEFSGTVEFTADGQRWRKLQRAKLLFEGYRVRTGPNSSATVVGQGEDVYEMGARAVLAVQNRALKMVSGQAVRPEAESGFAAFFGDLQRRFVSRQRYTTVRRNVEATAQVLTADHVTAGPDFPQLVWQNAGAGYRYRVVIGDRKFDVAATSAGAPYVSFELAGLTPGKHRMQIEVLDAAGAVQYVDPNGGELVWLDAAASAALKQKHETLLESPQNTDEDIAEFLAENDLLVPAMDHCRDYLAENPEDEAMTLAYLKVLKELRLDTLHAKQVEALRQVASAG